MNRPHTIRTLLAVSLLAGPIHAAVFDFGNGGTTANNSQNGGAGNWSPFANESTPVGTSASITIDGIGMTLVEATATDGNATADEYWGINNQGIGVITDANGGANGRRLDGSIGESIVFRFDTDVYLVSARFGSFAGGESVTITPQGGATITVTEPSGTNSPTTDYPLGEVFVTANTPITLSGTNVVGDGFLFNEITVVTGLVTDPPGDLVTSTLAAFPSPTVVANPTSAPNPGVTVVAAGNAKGQSFSLAAETEVTGFVFELGNVGMSGTFALELGRGMDRLPWLAPLVSDSGELPADLPATGGIVRVDLPEPVTLSRGTWTVTLEGMTADFQMPLSEDPLFPTGSLIRRNGSTGDRWDVGTLPEADLVFAVLGTQQAPPPVPAGKPNLVFILADDLGWTDVQCGPTGPNVLGGVNHGSGYYQTPNLVRLAQEGLSFTHAFVHPNCAPTRAALISGQYPSRSGNGVYHVDSLNRGGGATTFLGPSQNEDVPPSHVIWSEALQQAGYVTAHLGKYHLANHETGLASMPENQGFDCNFGGQQSGNPGSFFAGGGTWNNNIGPGLDAYAPAYTQGYVDTILKGPAGHPLNTRASDHPSIYPNAAPNHPDSLTGTDKHLTDAVGDAATAFIRDHASGTLSDRPFFMQVHFYAVHTPIQPRPDLATKYGSVPVGALHDNSSYAALVEGMDQNIGRILDRLDDPDGDGDPADSIAANTLVVFLSDNGGHIGPTDNDPLRHRKGSFWNGGLRVPMIVRQPGTVPASAQTDTLVHAVDFYPSFLEHAGVPLPAGITFDGESFAAHMQDPPGNPRDRSPIYYHFPGYLDQRARPVEVAIARIGGEDYKLIYNYDLDYTGNPSSTEDVEEGLDVLSEPWELYKFSEDISETSDLIDGSESNHLLYGGIADQMAAGLDAWLNQPDPDWEAHKLTVRATGQEVAFPGADVPGASVPFVQGFRIIQSTPDPEARSITLTWNSESGFHYDIEGSDGPGGWETLASDLPATGTTTTATVADPDLGSPSRTRRFYRVVLRP